MAAEAESQNPKRPLVVVRQDVCTCPRCDGYHTGVRFIAFHRGPDIYTHWALCPTTGEPLLLHARSA